MSALITYKSYQAFAPNGDKLIEADFAQPVNVKQELLHQMLVDMHGFTLDRNLNSNIRSQITLNFKDSSLQIERNYATKQTIIQPTADALPNELVGWRNEFILTPIADKKVLISQIQDVYKKLSSALPVAAAAGSELKQKLLTQGGEKMQRFLDASQKLTQLESELNRQRAKDEAILAQGEMEAALKGIDESINAVSELTQKHAQIKTELTKFHGLLQPDVDKKVKGLKQEMQNIRHTELNEEVSRAKSAIKPINHNEDDKPMRPFLAKFMLAFPLVLFAIGVLGYLLKSSYLIIALTVFAALVQLVFLAIINWIPPEIDISELSPRLRKIVEANVSKTKSSRERMLQLEKFFLDKAWAQALLQEEQNYKTMIKSRLGDVEFTDLQNTKLILQSQLGDLHAESNTSAEQDIPPEDYLRKRRELDMLRIDRSRLESELRGLPEYEQLQPMLDQFSTETRASETGRELNLEPVLPEYSKLKFENNRLSLFSTQTNEWAKVELEVKELLTIWVLLKLNYWQQAPNQPLILANILTKVADTAKLVLGQKLSTLSGLGQIVLVQTIA